MSRRACQVLSYIENVKRRIIILNKQFLETQEQKDILQQNVAIIKMEEKIILKEVLKLEHWLKIEFALVFFAVIGIGGIVIWETLF